MIQHAAIIAISNWITPIVIPGGLFVLMFIYIKLIQHRLVRQHIKSHKPMSDQDFVDQTGISCQEARLALTVREIIASAMGAPTQTVYPSENLGYVCTFHDGIDLIEIIIGIRDRFDVNVPDQDVDKLFDKDWETMTVKDFVHQVIEYVKNPATGAETSSA